MSEPAKPYTEAQIAGIERVAALADGATVPRLLASLAAVRAERDEARALLDQQAALHAEVERIGRGAIDRCIVFGERAVALEAERDAALAHAGTLLAIVERVADRLTANDCADVARLVAGVACERRAERETLARAEAERDALRAAASALLARVAEEAALDQCDRCEALATRQLTTMRHVHNLCDACDGLFCGHHEPGDPVADLPHAAALRALLALLPPGAT